MAGPPERISIFTPVSSRCGTSGPVTRSLPVSAVYPSPTMLYSAPCSASGFQSVWKTTVSGQTPLREPATLLLPPAAVVSPPAAAVVAAPAAVVAASLAAGAGVVSLLLLLSLPHAGTSSRLAPGTVSNVRLFIVVVLPLVVVVGLGLELKGTGWRCATCRPPCSRASRRR